MSNLNVSEETLLKLLTEELGEFIFITEKTSCTVDCPKMNDEKHSSKFFHPCPKGDSCKETKDDYHCNQFTHKCMERSCNDNSKLHRAQFTHYKLITEKIKCTKVNCTETGSFNHKEDYYHECSLIKKNGTCSLLKDFAHINRFTHPCQNGKDCKDKSKIHTTQFTHIVFMGICSFGKNCQKKDENHRIEYSHPCRDETKCNKLKDKNHYQRYNHPCKHVYIEDCGKFQKLDIEHIQKYSHVSRQSFDWPLEWESKPKKLKGQNSLVQISSKTQEYKNVIDNFKKSISFYVKNPTIVSLERNENFEMLERYLLKRMTIENSNKKENVNEKRLWHGTDEKTAQIVLKEGFDYRVSDLQKAKYGAGSYFALNASKSNSFATENSNKEKKMFLVLVTLGESQHVTSPCIGKRFPDPKPNSNQKYDSITGPNKTEFVIFNNDQVYPEYLITYKE